MGSIKSVRALQLNPGPTASGPIYCPSHTIEETLSLDKQKGKCKLPISCMLTSVYPTASRLLQCRCVSTPHTTDFYHASACLRPGGHKLLLLLWCALCTYNMAWHREGPWWIFIKNLSHLYQKYIFVCELILYKDSYCWQQFSSSKFSKSTKIWSCPVTIWTTQIALVLFLLLFFSLRGHKDVGR